MRIVDERILELLTAVLPPIVTEENAAAHPGVEFGALEPEARVHQGGAQVDNRTKVVTYALPYVTFNSNVGDDDDQTQRLTGRRTWRTVFFSVMFVGVTVDQAKWAGQRVRDQLENRHIIIEGHRTRRCRLQASQRVRRDDDAIRPNGEPLFYGIDEYELGVLVSTVPALVGA